MQAIKAIETQYKGYRFRSRLEARWAVFFDALDIKWEYEPQGYVVIGPCVDSQQWTYLPDFHLPGLGCWVEVKGSLDDTTDDYLEMIASAVDWGGALPGVSNSAGSTRGLLWLGPIPSYDQVRSGAPVHVIIQHMKGGVIHHCQFTWDGSLDVDSDAQDYFDSCWGDAGSAVIRNELAKTVYGRGFHYTHFACARPVAEAYDAARSARFEHGENPDGGLTHYHRVYYNDQEDRSGACRVCGRAIKPRFTRCFSCNRAYKSW